MHTEPVIPESLIEAAREFEDLDVANEFFANLRWPNGVTCPYCEGKHHSFISTRRVWACKTCKKRFSVKVGTIMEDSPIGLDKWIVAMWLLADCKNGISSHEVARSLKVSQKTAWFLMHRIRLAMKNGSVEKFSGTVEVDETFVGGKARNMHKDVRAKKITGTGTVGKAVVMGILKRKANGSPSQVRAEVVPNNKKRTVQPEVRENVAEGSTVYTDALQSYNGLNADYVHATVDHAVCYAKGAVHTNGMENFWCLLDRSINGSYVSVDPDHLTRYVDEQAFRFNERKSTAQRRFISVASRVAGKRLTWKVLTARDDAPGPRRGGGKGRPKK